MKDLTLGRRILLAGMGMAASGLVLHASISDAVVAGGDARLYHGEQRAALRLYRRALWIDSGNVVAADRMAFVALSTRNPSALREAVECISVLLHRSPSNAALRMDRALMYRRLGNLRAALSDFARVGTATHDPEALTFAGFSAERLGEKRRALAYWRATLAVSPRFTPALDGLHRYGVAR